MIFDRKTKIATAVAGVALGYLIGGGGQETPTETTPKPRTVSALNGLTGAKPEPAAEFDTVWQGRTASENIFLATTFASVRDPVKIRELLEKTDLLPANVSQGTARGILLRNWLEIDPHAAALWATKNADRHVGMLFDTWAANDLEGARAAVFEASPRYAPQLGAAVLESLAASGRTDEALSYLTEIEPLIGANTYPCKQAFRELATADPWGMLKFATSMTTASMRSRLRQGAAWAIAQSDLPAATAWWKEQPDQTELLEPLFQDAAPDQWGGILEQVTAENPRLSHYLHSMYYRWASRDREALLNVLASRIETSNNTIESQMFRSQVRYLIQNDREAATEWAANLTDESLRQVFDGQLENADDNAGSAPPATTAAEVFDGRDFEYYTIARLSPEERARLPEQLAEAPPARAAEALSQFLSHSEVLTADEVRSLFAAAPITTANEDRIVHTLTNFMDFAGQSPAETASWAEGFPPGPLQETAVAAAAHSWHPYEPDAARTWAESLADPAARSAALGALSALDPDPHDHQFIPSDLFGQ